MEKILTNDRETMLVAETPDQIVGWIVFRSPNRVRLSHTGSIGMMIDKESRNMGIGKLRSEEHTSELQSRGHLVCRLLLEKKKKINRIRPRVTPHDQFRYV